MCVRVSLTGCVTGVGNLRVCVTPDRRYFHGSYGATRVCGVKTF